MTVAAMPQDATSPQTAAQGAAAALLLRLAASDDEVSSFLTTLPDRSRPHGIQESCLADAMIVLGEVLNNIVEHAYRDRTDGVIELSLSFDPDGISVTTKDSGRPMPPAVLEGVSLPDAGDAVDHLPEGGFGLFLMHALAEDMTYERLDGANHLQFRLPTTS
jgi:serine/threonine-protein kinase RsbW